MNRSEPDYVAGKPGQYTVQPPITHPAYCPCAYCKSHRSPDQWGMPVVYRNVRRKSPAPKIRLESAVYARKVQAEEQRRLADLAEQAKVQQHARAGAITMRQVCDAYEAYLQKQKKNVDRDHYRLVVIRVYFGDDRDPCSISKRDLAAFMEHLLAERRASPATQLRYMNTLLAALNRAVKQDRIADHQLKMVEKPRVRKTTKPVTFSREQVSVLLGPAMDQFEAEQREALHQYDPESKRRAPSVVRLRGICLIGYYTAMRPANNFALTWEQLRLPDSGPASFRLDEHKNSSKGVEVEGALHPAVVSYLRALVSDDSQRNGLIHPNPRTGKPYRNITMQWKRLVAIANTMLSPAQQLRGRRACLYTLRHSGASHLAATSGNPVLVCRMMGDVELKTVMRHYFDSSIEDMAAAMTGWNLGNESEVESAAEGRSVAAGGNSQ